MSKKDDLTRVSAKDDDPVRKLCVRFNKDYIHTRDFKDAVAYLQLRGNGCPRKEAILFAAKNNCRVDTTKIIDGPRNYRTLQVQQVPTYMVSEGWLYGQQDYFFGSCFPSRYSETYLDYQMNNKLEENFDEQEVKMRKEYKEMIHRMKNYVKQVNQKYNFSNEQGEQLIDMVKKIVKGMKSELENRQYFVMNNIRYYDAAEAIMKKRMLSEEDKNILIEKLNVFNNYENEEDFQQVQIIKVNDDEQNDDNSPMKNPFFVGMFNNQVQKTAVSQQKQKFSLNGQSQNGNSNVTYAHQLKNLECATNLLEEFEKGEGEDMPNGPQGKFDRSYANQKKKRQEQMKQNLHLVRAENQAGLEGQFNQQKYFYSKQEKTFINLRKDQKVKEELQNAVFDIYKPNHEDGYYRYIDNISMLNQYTSQQKDSKYHSQGYDKVIQNSEDNKIEKDQLIDMDVIKLMKEKQDIYQKNFREKISSQAVLHQLKNQRYNQTQVNFRQTQSSSTRSRERETKTNFKTLNPFNQANEFKNHTFNSGLHNSIFGLKKHSSNLSLMNLSASKLKNSNSTNHLLNKFTTTPSTTIATSNNLHYKQQLPSSVQGIRSPNKLNLNKKFDFKKQSSKTSPLNQGNQDQKPKSRRIILRNFNNEELQPQQMKKEILPNRTVTWSVGGEQQNQFQIGSNNQSILQQSDMLQDHPAAQKKRRQDDSSQRSNSQSLVSNIRNSSSINISPLQNSPDHKLAQQYYYQGGNSKVEKNHLTQKEQLLQSMGNHQKKISIINESGFASNTIQSTNISSKAGVATNINFDFTPKSLNVFKQ
ncbi:hypothetical protein ABPG72_005243 [Tetrahymena utriculariae]